MSDTGLLNLHEIILVLHQSKFPDICNVTKGEYSALFIFKNKMLVSYLKSSLLLPVSNLYNDTVVTIVVPNKLNNLE